MNRKNIKRMLKIYSLVLATSLTFSSCKDKNNNSDNIYEYPWTGGVLSKEELVQKRKDEKNIAYTKKGKKL